MATLGGIYILKHHSKIASYISAMDDSQTPPPLISTWILYPPPDQQETPTPKVKNSNREPLKILNGYSSPLRFMSGKRAPYLFPSPTSHIKKSLLGVSLYQVSSELGKTTRPSSDTLIATSEGSEIATDDGRSIIPDFDTKTFPERFSSFNRSMSSQSCGNSTGSADTEIHTIPVAREWMTEDGESDQGSFRSTTSSQIIFTDGPITPSRSVSVASSKGSKSPSISPRLWMRRDLSKASATSAASKKLRTSPVQIVPPFETQGLSDSHMTCRTCTASPLLEVPSPAFLKGFGIGTSGCFNIEYQTSTVSSGFGECQSLIAEASGIQLKEDLKMRYEDCTTFLHQN